MTQNFRNVISKKTRKALARIREEASRVKIESLRVTKRERLSKIISAARAADVTIATLLKIKPKPCRSALMGDLKLLISLGLVRVTGCVYSRRRGRPAFVYGLTRAGVATSKRRKWNTDRPGRHSIR